MWNAASRCIFRRAFLALLALGVFAVTLQAPAGDAASKKVPSSTTSITVTQATETSLSISWQPVRRAAGYDLYLNRTRVATTQTPAYTLASLRCGATYEVGVDAFNAKGVRSSILSVAGSTSACPVAPVGNDTSPPTSPISLIQGATTATSISLLWSASLDNVGVAGYELFRNGNKVGTTTATSYTFPNLSCGTSYALAVDAFDAAGNHSQSAVVQASTSPCPDTTPPTIPALPTQTGSTATSISLLWSASLDNVGVAGYELFRNGNKVGTTTATSYTFPNLSCGTSYALAVDAFDAAGNRSQSAVVQASTSPCPDTTPPTIPALPTQTGSTATSISLLWSASLDNVGVAGYDLFLNGNKVGTTNATSYTFPNLSCGTSYALAVDAFDAAGNHSQRISLNGTTSACAGVAPQPPPPNKCTATLAAGGNAVSFFNRLSPGDVGCLHGGTYGGASVFSDFTKSGTSAAPITLQSYPGETATLQGYNAIDGSYVTFTNLKIDNTNTFTGSSECGGRYESFTLAGSNIVLDHNEITASDISHSSNGVYVTGSNEEIRFNKIHGVGACQNFDHGIYVGHGAGTQIQGNWIWNIPHGWGVQIYPSSSGVHAYSNVIDHTQNGFVLCSTGSNNLVEHNVVAYSIGAPGALTSGCGPQASSTGNVVSNNDQWNNPGGLGNVSGITYSGNISADPGFVDTASHDYEILPTSPLLSWSLWTGS
jgi:chitodextrinase